MERLFEFSQSPELLPNGRHCLGLALATKTSQTKKHRLPNACPHISAERRAPRSQRCNGIHFTPTASNSHSPSRVAFGGGRHGRNGANQPSLDTIMSIHEARCMYKGQTYFGIYEVIRSSDTEIVSVRYNGDETEASTCGLPASVVAETLLGELVVRRVCGDPARSKPRVAAVNPHTHAARLPERPPDRP